MESENTHKFVLVQQISTEVAQGEMSRPIKCLLCRQENPYMGSQSLQKDLGAVACSCDPSIMGPETRSSPGLAAQPVYRNTVRDAS